MNLFALVGAGVVLGAATSGVAIALVEPRDEAVSSIAAMSEDVTSRQCITAVPPEAMKTLGVLAPPVLTGRNDCEVQIGSRNILVSRRPLLSGGSAADQPVAARQAFEIACGLLADDESDVERDPDWLPASVPTCARTPVNSQGLSEVVVLSGRGSVVEIRVLQLDMAGVDQLHEGLSGLVSAAAVVW